jgi:hypothetical protein
LGDEVTATEVEQVMASVAQAEATYNSDNHILETEHFPANSKDTNWPREI